VKESWTNDIHDRLKGYRKKAPESWLTDVKKEMTRRGMKPQRAIVRPLWPRRAIAASVAVLLLGGALLWWSQGTVDEAPSVGNLPVAKTSSQPSNIVRQVKEVLGLSTDTKPLLAQSPHSAPAADALSSAEEILMSTSGKEEARPVDVPAPVAEEPVMEQSQSEESNIVGIPRKGYGSGTPSTRPSSPANKAGRSSKGGYARSSHSGSSSVLLGAYYGGRFASTTGNGTDMNDAASPSYNESLYRSMPDYVANTLDATGINYKEDAHHHQPVKVGLSVRYRLNDKWSLQSGVTYSYLSSTIDHEDLVSEGQTHQKLHYVGIPVTASYNLWGNRRFNVYVTAGGEIEKLVKGKRTDETYKYGKGTTTSKENVKESRPQFSATAAAGVEFKASKQFSIYVEPGASYYFDNGSDVDNYYKDKPFNFSLNVGLRMQVNK
jgi:opacity protein-like surface antigen